MFCVFALNGQQRCATPHRSLFVVGGFTHANAKQSTMQHAVLVTPKQRKKQACTHDHCMRMATRKCHEADPTTTSPSFTLTDTRDLNPHMRAATYATPDMRN